MGNFDVNVRWVRYREEISDRQGNRSQESCQKLVVHAPG